MDILNECLAKLKWKIFQTRDPMRQQALRRQLDRLHRAMNPSLPYRHRSKFPTRILLDLLQENGNVLHVRSNGLIDSGHQPFHDSKSNRCLMVDPVTGRWYCRSCKRGGDVVAFYAALHGLSYSDAEKALKERLKDGYTE